MGSRRGGLCIGIIGVTHTPRTFLTYQTTEQMPEHCVASEQRAQSWYTCVDTDQPLSASWKAHTLELGHRQQNWQKLWDATREAQHTNCARWGTRARKEEGQIEVLAGRANWHLCWQHKNHIPAPKNPLPTFPGTLAQNYPASSIACRIRAITTHTLTTEKQSPEKGCHHTGRRVCLCWQF